MEICKAPSPLALRFYSKKKKKKLYIQPLLSLSFLPFPYSFPRGPALNPSYTLTLSISSLVIILSPVDVRPNPCAFFFSWNASRSAFALARSVLLPCASWYSFAVARPELRGRESGGPTVRAVGVTWRP